MDRVSVDRVLIRLANGYDQEMSHSQGTGHEEKTQSTDSHNKIVKQPALSFSARCRKDTKNHATNQEFGINIVSGVTLQIHAIYAKMYKHISLG